MGATKSRGAVPALPSAKSLGLSGAGRKGLSQRGVNDKRAQAGGFSDYASYLKARASAGQKSAVKTSARAGVHQLGVAGVSSRSGVAAWGGSYTRVEIANRVSSAKWEAAARGLQQAHSKGLRTVRAYSVGVDLSGKKFARSSETVSLQKVVDYLAQEVAAGRTAGAALKELAQVGLDASQPYSGGGASADDLLRVTYLAGY